ncbi:protein phosphatase 2C domain-containing protein [Actinoplanes sp. NPDC049265]|uniref:protein phosphatase 2C domain-containing protein n=1 Tax=Actinoplanes sp. NPDC049265 TaxID=3363902 RepID=UPI003716BC6B
MSLPRHLYRLLFWPLTLLERRPPASAAAQRRHQPQQPGPRARETTVTANPPVPAQPGGERRNGSPPELSQWNSPVVGDPIHRFEPRPPASVSYRPDMVVDGWETDDLIVRAASIRGYVHRYRGTPRQDDMAVSLHRASGAVVFAVADGVSSARHSHIGASAACRASVNAIVARLDEGTDRIDWQGLVEQAAWQVIAQARAVLGDDTDTETAEREFATTLVAGLVRPTADGPEASMIHVGDSSAWILRGDRYQCLLESKYAPGADIVSSATTALPRMPRVTPRAGLLSAGEVLLLGTDGFGDPLGDGAGEVGRHFADALRRPGDPLRFARDLDFSRENFDDDRTLIALWPRSPQPPRRP